MRIILTEFRGIAPKFDEDQIAVGYAVTSDNTRPGRLMLEPWKAPKDVVLGSMPNNLVESVFFYEHDVDPTKWFTWIDRTYAVKAPLINDAYDMVIIASDGADAQVTDSSQHGIGGADSGAPAAYPLGIPRPDAPIVSGETDPNPGWTDPGGLTDDEFDDTYVSYITAYIDGWGRIGPVSAPSASVIHREHEFQSVYEATLTLDTDMPPIASVGRGLPQMRIYRSNFSAGAVGDYQFLKDVDAGTSTTKDAVFSGDLLDAPINEDWIGPPNNTPAEYPNGTMEKVIVVAGEFMCGHSTRILCFSEPDAPHAWPVEYYKVFQERIITVIASGANVVVLTSGFPYVVTGVHPSNMSPTRLADQIPCISALGVAEINDAIYYVAENGLYEVKGFGLTNVIKDTMTEAEWRELGTTTIRLSVYDDRLFISSQVAGKTYVFTPGNIQDGLRVADFDPQCTTQLVDTNDLAFIERGDSKLVVFDSHDTDYMALAWKSKVYSFVEPITFNCARVRSKSFPVTIKVVLEHEHGTHEVTKVVTDSDWFWLGIDYRGLRWWAEVTSTLGTERPEIHNFQIATSPQELD